MTAREALARAAERLRLAGVEDPAPEARILLEHALGATRAQLLARPLLPLDAAAQAVYEALVERRARREPLPYILGHQPFRALDLLVDPRALIPRPETELLVELSTDSATDSTDQDGDGPNPCPLPGAGRGTTEGGCTGDTPPSPEGGASSLPLPLGEGWGEGLTSTPRDEGKTEVSQLAYPNPFAEGERPPMAGESAEAVAESVDRAALSQRERGQDVSPHPSPLPEGEGTRRLPEGERTPFAARTSSVVPRSPAGKGARGLGPSSSAVDVGTGAGGIAISLAVEGGYRHVYATDLSPDALALARENAERHGVADRVTFLLGDLLEPLPESVDLIVANLPYVATADLAAQPELGWEPRLALDGGPDGLDAYRRLLEQAPGRLRPGGRLLFEIGAEQGAAAVALARRAFAEAEVLLHRDYAGRDRIVEVRLAGGRAVGAASVGRGDLSPTES